MKNTQKFNNFISVLVISGLTATHIAAAPIIVNGKVVTYGKIVNKTPDQLPNMMQLMLENATITPNFMSDYEEEVQQQNQMFLVAASSLIVAGTCAAYIFHQKCKNYQQRRQRTSPRLIDLDDEESNQSDTIEIIPLDEETGTLQPHTARSTGWDLLNTAKQAMLTMCLEVANITERNLLTQGGAARALTSKPKPSMKNSKVWGALIALKKKLPAYGLPPELIAQIAMEVTRDQSQQLYTYEERLNILMELIADDNSGKVRKELVDHMLDIRGSGKGVSSLYPYSYVNPFATEMGYEKLIPYWSQSLR